MKVMREGKPVELAAEVGRLEDGEKLVAAGDSSGAAMTTAKTLGMTLSILTDEQRQKFKIDADIEGAVVTAVEPDGPAAEKRIEPGDVITEAGQKPVDQSGRCRRRGSRMPRRRREELGAALRRQGRQAERDALHRGQDQEGLTNSSRR